MLLAAVLVVGLTACGSSTPAPSASSTAQPDNNNVPRYENEEFVSKAAYRSTEFTATANNGDSIRVWYKNIENSAATVVLYKYGLFGSEGAVLIFDVDGNSQKSQTYTDKKADTGRYFIDILSSDGGYISGYLKVRQIESFSKISSAIWIPVAKESASIAFSLRCTTA